MLFGFLSFLLTLRLVRKVPKLPPCRVQRPPVAVVDVLGRWPHFLVWTFPGPRGDDGYAHLDLICHLSRDMTHISLDASKYINMLRAEALDTLDVEITSKFLRLAQQPLLFYARKKRKSSIIFPFFPFSFLSRMGKIKDFFFFRRDLGVFPKK